MPRHRALAPVAALVLLGSALAVSAGVSPATAAPSGGGAQLKVAGVTAKVKAQQVTVSYSVSNRTKAPSPAGRSSSGSRPPSTPSGSRRPGPPRSPAGSPRRPRW